MRKALLSGVRLRLPLGFASMEDVERWVREHESYEVYSFDLFDTLLRRRIHPPQLVKRLVADRIADLSGEWGTRATADQVLVQRKAAEDALSLAAALKGRDPECSLNSVIAETLRSIDAKAFSHAEEIVDYEISLEKRATEIMPGAGSLLIYLGSLGKRMICVSDTYLSSLQVAMILGHHGLLKYFDKLYVSSDLGISKTTGRLFEHVVGNEGRNLLHIGDDCLRDHSVPEKLGVNTLWLHSRSERRRRANLNRLLTGGNTMHYVNAIIGCYRGAEATQQCRIGYEILGPALTVFVHNAMELARNDGVETLFFVARDGHIMKRIYQILGRQLHDNCSCPAGAYLCLSRIAVRARTDTERGLLRQYLAGVGFLGKRTVAVVDANSKGMTQSLLGEALASDPENPEVLGYYFNLLPYDNNGRTGKCLNLSNVVGVVSDWRREPKEDQVKFLLFGKLVEVFSHPNHGVTIGYREADGRTVPVFRKTSQESQSWERSEVQKGILSYAMDYGKYYSLHNSNCQELLRDVRRDISQWVRFPPKRDVEALRGVFLTDDWPQERNVSLVDKTGIKDMAALLRRRGKVGSSAWREGTLRLMPFPGLNLAYSQYRKFRRSGRS